MASQVYTITPKVRLIVDGADLYLDPLDSDSKDAIDAFFSAQGSNTTVAITKVAANRGGYGEDGPYYVLKLATS